MGRKGTTAADLRQVVIVDINGGSDNVNLSYNFCVHITASDPLKRLSC